VPLASAPENKRDGWMGCGKKERREKKNPSSFVLMRENFEPTAAEREGDDNTSVYVQFPGG